MEGSFMEKIYKVIAIISIVMCIVLMTWNVFLVKENTELKNNISMMGE